MLIVNTAAMATGPANEMRARMSAINARKHEAWTGVLVYGLMRYRKEEKGKARSRENANSWRDPAIICRNRPVKHLSTFMIELDNHIVHASHPESKDDESPDNKGSSFPNAIEEYLEDNKLISGQAMV